MFDKFKKLLLGTKPTKKKVENSLANLLGSKENNYVSTNPQNGTIFQLHTIEIATLQKEYKRTKELVWNDQEVHMYLDKITSGLYSKDTTFTHVDNIDPSGYAVDQFHWPINHLWVCVGKSEYMDSRRRNPDLRSDLLVFTGKNPVFRALCMMQIAYNQRNNQKINLIKKDEKVDVVAIGQNGIGSSDRAVLAFYNKISMEGGGETGVQLQFSHEVMKLAESIFKDLRPEALCDWRVNFSKGTYEYYSSYQGSGKAKSIITAVNNNQVLPWSVLEKN